MAAANEVANAAAVNSAIAGERRGIDLVAGAGGDGVMHFADMVIFCEERAECRVTYSGGSSVRRVRASADPGGECWSAHAC